MFDFRRPPEASADPWRLLGTSKDFWTPKGSPTRKEEGVGVAGARKQAWTVSVFSENICFKCTHKKEGEGERERERERSHDSDTRVRASGRCYASARRALLATKSGAAFEEGDHGGKHPRYAVRLTRMTTKAPF